jgi:putative transposon-encoded protein
VRRIDEICIYEYICSIFHGRMNVRYPAAEATQNMCLNHEVSVVYTDICTHVGSSANLLFGFRAYIIIHTRSCTLLLMDRLSIVIIAVDFCIRISEIH